MKTATFSAGRRICAIVPAAGCGTRLKADVPKVFVSILPELTIWDAVRSQLSQVATPIILILSSEGLNYQKNNPSAFKAQSFNDTILALQTSPRGMGDAIFGAAELWREFDDLLIVWGDQFNLSLQTLKACLELQARHKGPSLTLPLVRMPQPYVEYIFNSSGSLTYIRQSREGDICTPNGLSDIGVFILSGGRGLIEEWTRYQRSCTMGSMTGELNFLPFLIHLSSIGWPVNRYETNDPAEAIGINTPEDLAFARQLLQKRSSRS